MRHSLEDARRRDRRDALAPFRARFHRREGTVYMDGNSLGLLSTAAEAAVARVTEEWKTLAIDGWLSGAPPWYTLAETLAASVASLIGAEPDEVAVCNQTTVNIHQLLATLFQPQGARSKILADSLNFPSDLYAIRSHLALRGLDPDTHLILAPSGDGLTLDENDLIAAMTPDVAVALLPSVLFVNGQLLDVERLAAAARERGILLGIDASHSIGAVPHRFSEWGVDFAVWCHYKYLNGGPGAVGGLYLNRTHFGKPPGMAGWWGSRKDSQFDMHPVHAPALGAAALQIGTPSVLAMAPLQASLTMFAEAGMDRLRRKSLDLTAYLMDLVETELPGHAFQVGNPREEARRGGHVALMHPEATRITKALKDAGVAPDFRPPAIIRLAPAPLYTSFEDVWETVRRLKEIMDNRVYEKYPAGREMVA